MKVHPLKTNYNSQQQYFNENLPSIPKSILADTLLWDYGGSIDKQYLFVDYETNLTKKWKIISIQLCKH